MNSMKKVPTCFVRNHYFKKVYIISHRHAHYETVIQPLNLKVTTVC